MNVTGSVLTNKPALLSTLNYLARNNHALEIIVAHVIHAAFDISSIIKASPVCYARKIRRAKINHLRLRINCSTYARSARIIINEYDEANYELLMS